MRRSRIGTSISRTSSASSNTAMPRMIPISFGGSGPDTATITAPAAKITRPELARPPTIASRGSWLRVGSVLRQMTNGRLEGADYWSQNPAILSAGLGFDNIIGLPEINEATVREAGGAWYGSVTCTIGEAPADNNLTSAAAAGNLDQAYRGGDDVAYDDGLPVVFSWPVATETVTGTRPG